MSLDGNRVGDRIAADIQGYGVTAGVPITQNDLKRIWEIISGDYVSEIKSNADVLPASHGAEPLTNPVGQQVQVTDPQGGVGTGSTTVPQTIEGTGSIA